MVVLIQVVVKLSAAQRWILGCHPVLTEVNGGRHDVLGMFERPRESGRALDRLRTWNLETRAQVLERLEWLNIHGESRELDAVLESPDRAGGDGAEGLRAAVAEHGHVLRRVRFLAWDLGRLAAIAGWAYAAYRLDADVAWTVGQRPIPSPGCIPSAALARRAVDRTFPGTAATNQDTTTGHVFTRVKEGLGRGRWMPDQLDVGLSTSPCRTSCVPAGQTERSWW